MKYLLCIVYLIFSISGLTFMKLGSAESVKSFFEIAGLKFSLQSIVGYCCYAISFLLYTVVITKFDLSYIVPLLGGVVNIVVLIVGVSLFKEKVTAMSVCGAILVILGIILMNVKK